MVRAEGRGSRYHTVLTQQFTAQIIMEEAMKTIATQFKTFAGNEGSSNTLTKEEFQRLVISELPNLVQNANDTVVIDQLMSAQDANNDGELTFIEFWQVIGNLAREEFGFSQ